MHALSIIGADHVLKARSMLIPGALILSVLCLGGCDRSASSPSGEAPAKASQPARGIFLPDDAMAIVNGELILPEEFKLLVDQYESMDRRAFQALPGPQRQGLFSNILNQLVTHRILLQAAQRMGIRVEEERIEQAYQAFKSSYPSEEAFLEGLDRGKTNPTIWKKGTREAFMIQELEAAMAKELKIPEDEIKAYWNQNRDRHQQDLVHARQILVKTEMEAQQVLETLERGTSFEAAVKEHSIDLRTKDTAGDLGWLGRSEIPSEHQQTFFSLEPKEFSPPLEGRNGYYIVQVLEVKAADETSFEDYREKLRNLLMQLKWQAQRGDWIKGLKGESTILLAPGYVLEQ